MYFIFTRLHIFISVFYYITSSPCYQVRHLRYLLNKANMTVIKHSSWLTEVIEYRRQSNQDLFLISVWRVTSYILPTPLDNMSGPYVFYFRHSPGVQFHNGSRGRSSFIMDSDLALLTRIPPKTENKLCDRDQQALITCRNHLDIVSCYLTRNSKRCWR